MNTTTAPTLTPAQRRRLVDAIDNHGGTLTAGVSDRQFWPVVTRLRAAGLVAAGSLDVTPAAYEAIGRRASAVAAALIAGDDNYITELADRVGAEIGERGNLSEHAADGTLSPITVNVDSVNAKLAAAGHPARITAEHVERAGMVAAHAPTVVELDATHPDAGAAVGGRVFASTRGLATVLNDSRFRMRTARVGFRRLDLHGDDGRYLATLAEDDGAWLAYDTELVATHGNYGSYSDFATTVDAVRTMAAAGDIPGRVDPYLEPSAVPAGPPAIAEPWASMIPNPHPMANCGPLQMALPAGAACPTCGTVPTPPAEDAGWGQPDGMLGPTEAERAAGDQVAALRAASDRFEAACDSGVDVDERARELAKALGTVATGILAVAITTALADGRIAPATTHPTIVEGPDSAGHLSASCTQCTASATGLEDVVEAVAAALRHGPLAATFDLGTLAELVVDDLDAADLEVLTELTSEALTGPRDAQVEQTVADLVDAIKTGRPLGPPWYRNPDAGQPFDGGPGIGIVAGYVVGWCGHRVAGSEWRAGFRVCERDDKSQWIARPSAG